MPCSPLKLRPHPALRRRLLAVLVSTAVEAAVRESVEAEEEISTPPVPPERDTGPGEMRAREEEPYTLAEPPPATNSREDRGASMRRGAVGEEEEMEMAAAPRERRPVPAPALSNREAPPYREALVSETPASTEEV